MRICIFSAPAPSAVILRCGSRSPGMMSCVMRGPHLDAVKTRGLTLRVGSAEFSARVKASDDLAALGPLDFVVSTLKANG
jgi:2-dehydropantoate 2-reductase